MTTLSISFPGCLERHAHAGIQSRNAQNEAATVVVNKSEFLQYPDWMDTVADSKVCPTCLSPLHYIHPDE